MKKYEFGDADAGIVLIRPAGTHEIKGIENEFALIKKSCDKKFYMIALMIEDWNKELSPWEAPAVFGKNGFGSGAEETLQKVMTLCGDKSRSYYIGGYSLAGLFALWAAVRTDRFCGVAAASPSVWFPGFKEYIKTQGIKTDTVYLSLGDKEEKTKNPVMSAVGDNIREIYAFIKGCGIDCVLEWNEGNHFRDTDVRMAKAFAGVMKEKEMADGKI